MNMILIEIIKINKNEAHAFIAGQNFENSPKIIKGKSNVCLIPLDLCFYLEKFFFK